MGGHPALVVLLLGCVFVCATAEEETTNQECVQGWNGDPMTTTQAWKKSLSRDKRIDQLAMCNQWKDTCCAAIHDAEIGDAFKHLVDVADKCLQTTNTQNPQLHQYFCLFCHPKHIEYMECCHNMTFVELVPGNGQPVFKCGDNNGDGIRHATPYGEGNCTSKAVNTVRLCKPWAEKLWKIDAGNQDKDLQGMLMTGEDKCGFSVYTGSEDGFNGGTKPDGETKVTFPNPNGIVGWGDVNGGTGDDPVLPGKFWGSVEEFFRDTRPPLLDDFFLEVVEVDPNSKARCFGSGGASGRLSASLVMTVLVASIMAANLALLESR